MTASQQAITVLYSSFDGTRIRRAYKTLAAARRFAHYYVGPHPELGGRYAVSADGVGKIVAQGCSLAELFPTPAAELQA